MICASISRTSVMRFKGTKLSVPEIARTLGVDALVEGSVIRQGSRIRVHAQLIRGSTDEHLWSDEYDGELGDVLALESEVAQSIARRVEVKVTGEERARLVAAHHVSPEVYESYLKAEDELGKVANLKRALPTLRRRSERTLTLPRLTSALRSHTRGSDRYLAVPRPKETHPKMMSAARKAIELDPDLAEPHVLLAGVYQKQWQWSDAEAEYKRALELNSNDAGAQSDTLLGGCCARGGRTRPWCGPSVPANLIRLEAPACIRMASFCFMPDVTTRPSGNCEATIRTIGIWVSR